MDQNMKMDKKIKIDEKTKMVRTESADSNASDSYEMCRRNSDSCSLRFDPASIEDIILSIGDTFDLRVLMSSERAQKAVLITSGLALAGGVLGGHFGGRSGAALGSAVGGACGLGLVAYSLRDVWSDVRWRAAELVELVYDYLGGLGLQDYAAAAAFLVAHSSDTRRLGVIITKYLATNLGKQVVSSLMP